MKTIDEIMNDIDIILAHGVPPYQGWHNERLVPDRAALQQDRREFKLMLEFIKEHIPEFAEGSCLQLGLGPSGASHGVWRRVFAHVVTIDLSIMLSNDNAAEGKSTHSIDALIFAKERGPYDFLFIDAGHSYEDVLLDYRAYGPLVRSGGIIAFHDALERAGYPEVKVHKFLDDERMPVMIFGDEVGTACMVKR